jgi:hypothetical protein
MIPAVTAALAQTGWLPGGFGTQPDPAAAPPAPVLASLPDASQSGAQDMAARAAAERAGIVVRADGPLPEPPATPAAPKQTIPVSATPEVVEPDGMPRIDSLTDGLRGVLFQGSIALSAFLLTMALGLHLTRRNRKRPAALPDRDPWDRLSERLR